MLETDLSGVLLTLDPNPPFHQNTSFFLENNLEVKKKEKEIKMTFTPAVVQRTHWCANTFPLHSRRPQNSFAEIVAGKSVACLMHVCIF